MLSVKSVCLVKNQSVLIFIAPALLRAVGFAEKPDHGQFCSYFFVSGEFCAIIGGDCFDASFVVSECFYHGCFDCFGFFIWEYFDEVKM